MRQTIRRRARRLARLGIVKTRRALASTAGATPELSVVIPVYNVEEYLADCLDSVLAQSLRNIEVIAVDDGSTDRSWHILKEFSGRDPRLRIYRQQNAGQGAARNVGVAKSSAPFLTFVDADDLIPADAFRSQVRGLQRSGSDFSVGATRRIQNGKSGVPWTDAVVHGRDRIGIGIDDFPEALLDVIACNRMFRREFWVERVGGFRGGIAYEDHVPMVVAYVRSARFDVLRRVTYTWRIRENNTSTSQRKKEVQNLRDRIEVKAEAQEILLREASASTYAMWLGRVLDTDFSLFVEYALSADDDYRSTLQAATANYLEAATPEAWSWVRVHQKLRSWLAARGAWDELENLESYFREFGKIPPTKIRDGRVVVSGPLHEVVGSPIPEHLLELASTQTNLVVRLRRVGWASPSALELTGRAYIENVDQSHRRPEQSIVLCGPDGQRIPFQVTPVEAAPDDTMGDKMNAGYAGSAFRAIADVSAVAATALDTVGRAPSLWTIEFRVAVDEVERTGHALQFIPGSAATPHALCASSHDGVVLTPRWDEADGLVLAVGAPRVEAVELALEDGELLGVLESSLDLTDVMVPGAGPQRPARASVVGDAGRYTFQLPFPEPGAPAAGSLLAITASGKRIPIHWSDSLGQDGIGVRSASSTALVPDRRRLVEVSRGLPLLNIEKVTREADAVVFLLAFVGISEQELRTLSLTDDHGSYPVEALDLVDSQHAKVRLPNSHQRFGVQDVPLDVGHYRLTATLESGTPLSAGASPDYLQSLPLEQDTPWHTWRFILTPNETVRVSLLPPLASDERGRHHQRALQSWYQNAHFTPEASVLFQCYRGEFATDSQLALHEELRRTRPDLTLFWGTASPATQVPEGGVPLLIGSRAWYAALGSSRYLCHNVDFDLFFRKKEHQEFLQTFHGYPFKSMGKSLWRGTGYSPGQIDRECARANMNWDTILVPSEECADMYRAEYDFAGRILVTGYPRSDSLVTADRAEVRAETLRRIGVAGDRKVVLYAPTYRDNLTTRLFSAKRFDALDLDQLRRGLGEQYIVLLRGHNNNQREPDRVHDLAQVVDVTDYPEINDLTIAADAAILDYSSLRFDWALTGKPMVFFVPDKDAYFAERPPLFSFEESAPGPLVETTAQVVAALRDLEALHASQADAIAAFNQRFNGLQDGQAAKRVVEQFFSA